MNDEQKLAALGPEKTPDFCVTLDFPRNTRNPQHLLKAAAAYIDTLDSLDVLLVSSIDTQIKPVFVLEEVETGSIKFWLKQILEAVNDNALENIDWKPAVGKYLVKAKYRFLKYLEGKNTIGDRAGMEALAKDISNAAKETGVLRLPAYRAVDATSLAQEALKVGNALSGLDKEDSISFSCDDGDSVLRSDFIVTQEEIDFLFAGESITNDLTRILMVKRPDFLGESRWEFRYERKPFYAKISDENWLKDFHDGKIDIRPGDALRVILRENVIYDHGGEVLKEEREILEVTGIIKPASQGSLV